MTDKEMKDLLLYKIEDYNELKKKRRSNKQQEELYRLKKQIEELTNILIERGVK